MKNYLEILNWRYATKRFDTSKKINDEDIETLKEVIRLSASSYGLQPYQVLVIEDEATKEKLRAASFNQPQLTEASHIIVFASYTEVTEGHIDGYLENIADTRNLDIDKLAPFKQTMSGAILQRSKEQQAIWAAKQTYIGLGNLLSAAASLKIDACPMEGFNASEFDKILKLTEKGLTASVIAAVGYRSKEDITQNQRKVRKPEQELFITI